MQRDRFYFDLPSRLIAQKLKSDPAKTKLLVLSRRKDRVVHSNFEDLGRHLHRGDMLVFNNTAVIPTRMWGVLDSGGQVEITLISKIEKDIWEALVRPLYNFKRGAKIFLGGGKLAAALLQKMGSGIYRLKFKYKNNLNLEKILNKIADINIPFYIRRKLKSPHEYQTIYAKKPGSTQCPTAGLHFTKKIMNDLNGDGIEFAFITLHIGGSALPVSVSDFDKFNLPKEYFEIKKKTAEKINKAKKYGRRIIAVGTTAARVLETAADKEGNLKARRGWTGLTIKPDYKFKIIDGFLTNFHLPGSSHLLLTAAFGGIQRVLDSYREAIKKRYKFLDFGDAMFII